MRWKRNVFMMSLVLAIADGLMFLSLRGVPAYFRPPSDSPWKHYLFLFVLWGPLAVWWGWRGFRHIQESRAGRLATLHYARDAFLSVSFGHGGSLSWVLTQFL